MAHLRWPANKRSLSPPPPSGTRSRSASSESPSHKRAHRRAATLSSTPSPLHQSSPDYSSPVATSPSPSPAKAAFRERERPLFRPEPDSSDSEDEGFRGFREPEVDTPRLGDADVEMEDCKPVLPSSPPAAEVTHAASPRLVKAETEKELLAKVKEEDEDSTYGARRPGETYEVELAPFVPVMADVLEAPTPVTPSTSPTTSRTQPKPINNRFVFNFPPVPVASSSSPLQTPPSTQRRTPAEIAALREAAKARLEATKRRTEQLAATPVQPTPPLRPPNTNIPPQLSSTLSLRTSSLLVSPKFELKPPPALLRSGPSDTILDPVLVRPHLHLIPSPSPLALKPNISSHPLTVPTRATSAGPFDALPPPRSKCETFLRFAAEAFAEAGGEREQEFLEQASELVSLATSHRRRAGSEAQG